MSVKARTEASPQSVDAKTTEEKKQSRGGSRSLPDEHGAIIFGGSTAGLQRSRDADIIYVDLTVEVALIICINQFYSFNHFRCYVAAEIQL